MKDLMHEFTAVVARPWASLADTKKRTGRKAIACFPMYVPHELVEAAGMLPVDLWGGSGEMTAAAEYLQSITCYPVRSAFELLLTKQLDQLDGAIFSSVCTGALSGGAIWQQINALPFYHQFVVPAEGGRASGYLTSRVLRLKSALEDFAGRPISGQSLSESIALYNRGRATLEKLDAVSQRNPDSLPPQDFGVVRAAAAFMARGEYNELLSRLLAKVESTGAADHERARLLLVGSLCDLPQFEFLKVVHEAGAVVVADDTFLGRRAWMAVPETHDPVDALVQHYFALPPCPTKRGKSLDDNFDYLLGLAQSSRAQGAVLLRPLYCDVAGIDYASLATRLQTAGVPTLGLELNGREVATGQVQTRLQAFVEMLRR